MKLKVSGMHCNSCEVILRDDVGAVNGVKKVGADFKKGEVWFEGDEKAFPEVKKAIEANGYKVDGII